VCQVNVCAFAGSTEKKRTAPSAKRITVDNDGMCIKTTSLKGFDVLGLHLGNKPKCQRREGLTT
jgi:hypothetical protein